MPDPGDTKAGGSTGLKDGASTRGSTSGNKSGVGGGGGGGGGATGSRGSSTGSVGSRSGSNAPGNVGGSGGANSRGPGGPSGPNSSPSGTRGIGGGGQGGQRGAGGQGTQTPAGGKTNFGGGVGGNNSKVGGPGAGGMGANNVRSGSSTGVVGPNSGMGAPGNIGNSWKDGQLQQGTRNASFTDKVEGIQTRSDNAFATAGKLNDIAQRNQRMADQYSQYRAPPGAAPQRQAAAPQGVRDDRAPSVRADNFRAPTDVTRSVQPDVEVTRAINAAGVRAALAAGRPVPGVASGLTTNDLYGKRPSGPQSATAAEHLAKTNFGYSQIGSLYNDPAINPALPTALTTGLWNQRIQDATRLATNPKYKGTFGERDLAPWDDAGLRTKEEAARNAAAGTGIKDSFHNYGLAADVVAPNFPGYDAPKKEFNAWQNASARANQELASLIENDDIRWGGTFSNVDPSHFQLGTGSRSQAIKDFGSTVTREGVRPDGFVGPTASYGNQRPNTPQTANTGRIEPASVNTDFEKLSNMATRPGVSAGRIAGVNPPDGRTSADIAGIGDDGLTDGDIMRQIGAGTWTQSYDRPQSNPNLGTSSIVNGGLGIQGYGNGLATGDLATDGVNVSSRSPPRQNTVPDWKQSSYTGRQPTEVNINGGRDSYDPLGSISAPPPRTPQDRMSVVGGAGFQAFNSDAGIRGPDFATGRLSPEDRDTFYGGRSTPTATNSPGEPAWDGKPQYSDPIMGPADQLPETPKVWAGVEKVPYVGPLAKGFRMLGGLEWDHLSDAERESLMQKWSEQNATYGRSGDSLGGSRNELPRPSALGAANNAYIPRDVVAPPPTDDPKNEDEDVDPWGRRRRLGMPADPYSYGYGPGFNYFTYQ